MLVGNLKWHTRRRHEFLESPQIPGEKDIIIEVYYGCFRGMMDT